MTFTKSSRMYLTSTTIICMPSSWITGPGAIGMPISVPGTGKDALPRTTACETSPFIRAKNSFIFLITEMNGVLNAAFSAKRQEVQTDIRSFAPRAMRPSSIRIMMTRMTTRILTGDAEPVQKKACWNSAQNILRSLSPERIFLYI